ncbi:MAG: DUF3987 domain-containing protein [Leptospirillum sp.]
MPYFSTILSDESIESGEELYPELDLTVPVIHPAAFHGPAGEFVHALDPHTEADPIAVLIHALIFFGIAVGRSPHMMVDGARHGTNEFAVVVGVSGKARKGTSEARTRETFIFSGGDFVSERIKGGLSTGEGLINQVRDPVERMNNEGLLEVVDPGVEDKRLLAIEPEFGGLLKIIERDGNSLSAVLRMAWDGNKLSPLTKGNRIEATNPHIGIIGHITKEELLHRFSATEANNGFGNRILWVFARRSKFLPEGGNFNGQEYYGKEFGAIVSWASNVGLMKRSDAFRAAWNDIYRDLSDGRPGLAGALTNRQEAHALRLSIIYALLDRSDTLDLPHLSAALAITSYVRETVEWIFGRKQTDPTSAKILEFLSTGPKTQTEINHFLSKNKSSTEIENILKSLVDAGQIACRQEPTAGRPRNLWFLR